MKHASIALLLIALGLGLTWLSHLELLTWQTICGIAALLSGAAVGLVVSK
jgi:hypothetical protein